MVNDTPGLDVDAPIPYTLTSKGRLDVLELRNEERQAVCDHKWEIHHGNASCWLCDKTIAMSRRSDTLPVKRKAD
jgi:hypothetical protein